MAGDGIGPEVIEPALAELPQGTEVVRIDAGAERYLSTGELITDGDLEAIKDSDALLFGAVGDPRVPDGVLERGVILRLRKELDLYINLRPFPELGLTFVRENSEGPYAGVGERTAISRPRPRSIPARASSGASDSPSTSRQSAASGSTWCTRPT